MKTGDIISAISLIASLMLAGCNSEPENKYTDGKKDGDWIEYINAYGNLEVPIDSAAYNRRVTYSMGKPVGMAKDYYLNGNIQCEFYLVSSPYILNGKRPADKFKGLIKWFSENPSYIENWKYYDDFGKSDFKKYYVNGYSLVEDDKRFNKSYFLSLNDDNKDLDKLFLKFKDNPQLFDQEMSEITSELYSDPDLRELMNTSNESLKDAFMSLLIFRRLQSNLESNGLEFSSESEGDSQQSDSRNYQNQNNPQQRQCSYCRGTGRCPACNKAFRVRYWDNGWKSENETRPGKVMCDDCDGSGKIYGTSKWPGEEPSWKPCYVSSCNNGWKNCPECNYNGDGERLGECRHCRGTGVER